MRPGSFLRRKHSAYQFRFALPKPLARISNRGELLVGLRTTSYPVALDRARALRSRVGCLMSDLVHVTTKLEAERRIRAWIDAQVASFEHDLAAHGSAFFSQEEAQTMGAEQTAEVNALLAGCGRIALEDTWRPMVGAGLAGRSPISAKLTAAASEILMSAGVSDTSPMTRRVALRGLISLLEERLALESGEVASIPLHWEERSAATPVPAPVATPDEDAAASFFEHWDAFVADKLRTGEWKADMADNAAPARKLFEGLIGNVPFTSIDRRVASDFRAGLYRLPRFYDKAERWRDIPIRELGDTVEAAQKHAKASGEAAIALLKSATINKHLTNLSTYVSWCREHGRIDEKMENPFPKMMAKRKRGRAARDERPEWSVDMQRKLFTGPVWTGCFSIHRRHRSGPHIFRDALFWMPLAGRTMGPRSDELANARVGDIRFDGGVVYLAIRDAKTDSSTRDLPISQLLLDCGFLEYRVHGRDPNERLFPELIPQGSAERASEAFSGRFTYHRKKLGVYVEGMDFHAFRHSITTDLANMADIKEGWVDELTGHASEARRSESTRYTKLIYLQHLKDTLNRIVLPVDMSHLHYSGERGKPAPGARVDIDFYTELAEREMQKKKGGKKRKHRPQDHQTAAATTG